MSAFGALKSILGWWKRLFVSCISLCSLATPLYESPFLRTLVWFPIFERTITVVEKRPLYGTLSLGILNSLCMAFIITLRLVNCWLTCQVHLTCLGDHQLYLRLFPWKRKAHSGHHLFVAVEQSWNLNQNNPPPLPFNVISRKRKGSDITLLWYFQVYLVSLFPQASQQLEKSLHSGQPIFKCSTRFNPLSFLQPWTHGFLEVLARAQAEKKVFCICAEQTLHSVENCAKLPSLWSV